MQNTAKSKSPLDGSQAISPVNKGCMEKIKTAEKDNKLSNFNFLNKIISRQAEIQCRNRFVIWNIAKLPPPIYASNINDAVCIGR